MANSSHPRAELIFWPRLISIHTSSFRPAFQHFPASKQRLILLFRVRWKQLYQFCEGAHSIIIWSFICQQAQCLQKSFSFAFNKLKSKIFWQNAFICSNNFVCCTFWWNSLRDGIHASRVFPRNTRLTGAVPSDHVACVMQSKHFVTKFFMIKASRMQETNLTVFHFH